jgi:hypothetical protein
VLRQNRKESKQVRKLQKQNVSILLELSGAKHINVKNNNIIANHLIQIKVCQGNMRPLFSAYHTIGGIDKTNR